MILKKSKSKIKKEYCTHKTNPAKPLNNNTFANTDNMGKLFVMVFAFAPASLTDL